MSYVSDPASKATAVTPSDTTVLDPPTRSLYIGGTGNLAVRMVSGDIVTFQSVPVGIFPIRVDKVLAAGSGTTATNIIALS